MDSLYKIRDLQKSFPMVLGWKFKGNGQVSVGNSRETDISISPLRNHEECVRFPKISLTKNVVKFLSFLQWMKSYKQIIFFDIT